MLGHFRDLEASLRKALEGRVEIHLRTTAEESERRRAGPTLSTSLAQMVCNTMRHLNRSHSQFAGLGFLVAAWPVTFAMFASLACQALPESSDGGAPGATPTNGADSGKTIADAGASTPPGSEAGTVTPPGGGANDASATDEGDAAPLPVMINYLPGATVSTLAGSSVAGTLDGTGAAAQFDNPTGMALDANGNLLVTDYDSGRVRLVSPAGVVTTIAAGTGFVNPFASVVATDGSYYVQTDANASGVKDTMTGTIWRVTPLSDGAIAMPTVVGQNLGRPRGMAPIAGGNLFVVDRTQEIAETLAVTTGQTPFLAGAVTIAGYVNATGAAARFNSPIGAAAMPDGSFLVTDEANNVVRRVTAGGVVTTFAGNGSPTLVDGPCASASFNAARGVAVDAEGNAYVSDIGNHVIRRISVACVVETVAGDGTAGFNDGAGNLAEFYGQEGIGVTPDGTTVYVADGNGGDGSAHQRVRAIAIP